jgi:hypothetical protein
MHPDRSFTIFLGAGDEEGISMDINDLLGSDLPTKAERTHETAHKPFSAAEYFTFVFDLIVKYIIGIFDLIYIGWDAEKEESYPDGGIFNIIRNFGSRIEEQIDGTLHAHWILWGWNLPTKQADVRKLHEEDEDFSQRVSDWLDQIKGLNSPILAEYANKCPDCGFALEPIPPTIGMFKKGNKKNGPPLTCKCIICDRSFSSYQLNLLYVDKFALENGITKEEYSGDKVDKWMASCEYFDISEPFQKIVFSLALLDIQFHYWHHAK